MEVLASQPGLVNQKLSLKSAITDSTIAAVISMAQIDLEHSLQLGSPTVFTLQEAENGYKPLSRFPSMCLQSDDSILPQALGQYPARALPANYRDLFVEVLFLASLLNSAILGNAPKMDAVELYQDIIFLGYPLVNLRPLGLSAGSRGFRTRSSHFKPMEASCVGFNGNMHVAEDSKL
ncbi:hypothetical protein PENARI_c052G00645 [Penicillium arizonense]|uniref:Uncharacterized protein n=1 Tax=Penicillium arizonense TaxID=1835702 RepID=A0A1F5L200_PENAI|nr:hypothetical protein PENARI_c052G00645 [Penicillium arizonense]OGE47253.1 hypothetical protein PENARI_c052G00645 [Penicillium arizonense]